MNIKRNKVSLSMSLDEFLDVLESDLIDDLLIAIVELDEAGVEAEFEAKLEDFEYEDEDEMETISTVYMIGEDGEEAPLNYWHKKAEPMYYTEADYQVKRMLEYFPLEEEDDDYI